MNRPVRIVVFAKAPLPGFAKTRLIPALGAQGAADLARQLLAHRLEAALAAQVGPVELCVTPPAAESVWRTFPVPKAVQWTDQGEGDLGARMARAAQRTLAAGEPVLLIGTDCPALNATELKHAARALQHADATLVPAFDGGYVLLGLNRFHPTLFSHIVWSTDTVAAETMRRFHALDWTVHRRPTLHDIDEPADLQYLPDACKNHALPSD